MAKKDQELRGKAMEDRTNKKLIKQVYACDGKNLEEVKKIISKYSWPTFDLIRKRASHSFWLLIQHADRDVNFQRKCLKLLIRAVEEKQAHQKDLEHLIDRVLIAETRKQRYGTHMMFKDGKAVPYPKIQNKDFNEFIKGIVNDCKAGLIKNG